MDQYLYVSPNLGEVATIESSELAGTEDRHRVSLAVSEPVVCLDVDTELARRQNIKGVVIALDRGWPGASHLRFASRAMRRGRVWFYWPSEEAVECLDPERLNAQRQ